MSEDSLVGKEVLGFKLTDIISSSETSEVYSAEPAGFGIDNVVFKFAKNQSNQDNLDKINQDILTSAKRQSNLHDKKIVKVLNSGEYNGRNFMILEKMHGSLSDLLEKDAIGGIPLKDNYSVVIKDNYSVVINAVRDVLSALTIPHVNHILHQDITPDNILFKVDDGDITFKLNDFFNTEIYENSNSHTDDISSVGSEEKDSLVDKRGRYLSPDVRNGKSASSQSDLYSLGAVIYEYLMGEIPWGNYKKISSKHKDIPKDLEIGIEKLLSLDENEQFKTTNKAFSYFNNVEDKKSGKKESSENIENRIEKLEEKQEKSEDENKKKSLFSEILYYSGLTGVVLACLTGASALIYHGVSKDIKAREELEQTIKKTKNKIAYVKNNTLGFYDLASGKTEEYRLFAKDLVDIRWRSDSKKLLLTDEPLEPKYVRGDAADTSLYVFDVETEKGNLILDVKDANENIQEAYWCKNDKNKICARIDDNWYYLDASKDNSKTYKETRAISGTLMDLDTYSQYKGPNGKLYISDRGTLLVKHVDKPRRISKYLNIFAHAFAWQPKVEEENIPEKQSKKE